MYDLYIDCTYPSILATVYYGMVQVRPDGRRMYHVHNVKGIAHGETDREVNMLTHNCKGDLWITFKSSSIA